MNQQLKEYIAYLISLVAFGVVGLYAGIQIGCP